MSLCERVRQSGWMFLTSVWVAAAAAVQSAQEGSSLSADWTLIARAALSAYKCLRQFRAGRSLFERVTLLFHSDGSLNWLQRREEHPTCCLEWCSDEPLPVSMQIWTCCSTWVIFPKRNDYNIDPIWAFFSLAWGITLIFWVSCKQTETSTTSVSTFNNCNSSHAPFRLAVTRL